MCKSVVLLRTLLALLAAAASVAPAFPAPLPAREPRPRQDRPRSVIELQAGREQASLAVDDGTGRSGRATLINLNPLVNAWFVLSLTWQDGERLQYHLENRAPGTHRLRLEENHPHGLVLADPGGVERACDLWSGGRDSALARARTSQLIYVPLCGDRLLLRNRVRGHQTLLELTTDLLRRHVWGGEAIVGFVRDEVLKDARLSTSPSQADGPSPPPTPPPERPGAPAPARLADGVVPRLLLPKDLGIAVEGASADGMLAGWWYPAADLPGVWLSVFEPGLAPPLPASRRGTRPATDPVEERALAYLVAFDLAHFDLGFSLGTEHPRVDWSPRVPPGQQVASLPGPDGFDRVDPLVRTGLLSPTEGARIAATFAGGFKREHGAFKWGALANREHGSHYGFVEEGVVLSRLVPGLATALAWTDGRVEVRTWSARDEARLGEVRYARQNGVPLVEPDPATGRPLAGALVGQWGPGNWSGSVDKRLRTVRAGLAIQEHGGKRFLVFGYFSSATPPGLARAFLAYQVSYAMQTDINAPEHTYLAVYRVEGGQFRVQYLVRDMRVLDRAAHGLLVPRFVGYSDNRDFFWLLQKEAP
jgi:hypothetical protein